MLGGMTISTKTQRKTYSVEQVRAMLDGEGWDPDTIDTALELFPTLAYLSEHEVQRCRNLLPDLAFNPWGG